MITYNLCNIRRITILISKFLEFGVIITLALSMMWRWNPKLIPIPSLFFSFLVGISLDKSNTSEGIHSPFSVSYFMLFSLYILFFRLGLWIRASLFYCRFLGALVIIDITLLTLRVYSYKYNISNPTCFAFYSHSFPKTCMWTLLMLVISYVYCILCRYLLLHVKESWERITLMCHWILWHIIFFINKIRTRF